MNSLMTFAETERDLKVASPQTQRTPGRTDEVKNDAGGYVFGVSDQARLERFLILGTDGGTYYVNESSHASNNVTFLREMIAKDERAVVDTAVAISEGGRAYKNSPAIFAMALVLSEGKDKAYARSVFSKVVRTSTHLFEFVSYIDALGGWGSSKRKAIAGWYAEKGDGLAYQAVKYRSRHSWSHRDVWRKVHPVGLNPAIGAFVLRNEISDESPEIIKGFGKAQESVSVGDTLSVLDQYKGLPWESLRTEHLKDVRIWKKLFYNNQLNGQALFRNITRLAKADAFSDMKFAHDYAMRLMDEDMLAKTRIHPVNILNTIVVYTEGQKNRDSSWSMSRSKTWDTEPVILDALNEAFYRSFKYAEGAGKRTYIGVDVSPSMGVAAMGNTELTSSQAAAAIAMTIARTEPWHTIRGFASAGGFGRSRSGLMDLKVSAKTSLQAAFKEVGPKGNWGGTDCALPMLDALDRGIEVDTFVVITDNDTWAGSIKPTQALKQYRSKTGIDAKLIVLGTASTGFTIADPLDKGQLDVVGFDANVPKIVADFSAGRI